MKRTITIVAAMVCTTSAWAQDSGETTREVVGFSDDGKVVVRAISQGERIVDGTSKSYYFELDELWDPRLGNALEAHRREANGFEHPAWQKANETPLNFHSIVPGQVSPNGTHLLVTVSNEAAQRVAGQWTCTTTNRTVLMSRDAGAAFTVDERSASGPTASREGATQCPRVSTSYGWSKDNSRFVVEVRFDGEFGIVTGSTNSTGEYAEKPLQNSAPIDPLGTLTVGPVRTAWEALLADDSDRAEAALAKDDETTGWARLATAWIAGKRGDAAAAKKIARKAEKGVKGDPIGLAMLGGAYALADDNRRVKRTLNSALKAADSWQQYVQMAAILKNVDLSLFNQVLVYGLSSDDGKANAEPWAWRLLIDGLVDAGLPDKGVALLERFPADHPQRAGAEARLAIGAGDGKKARPLARTLVWADSGNCDGYLLAGRADLLTGSPATAMPLLTAAGFCNGNAAEAWYFLAELHRAAGRPPAAIAAATNYLKAATSRRNDALRDLRRDRAKKTVDRLAVAGLGLVSLTCRPQGAAYLCQGVVVNSGASPVEGAVATITRKETELGKSEIATVPPLETRSFGVRVEAIDDASFAVGRDDEEKKRNTVLNLRRGW